jgi:hypothetical protein
MKLSLVSILGLLLLVGAPIRARADYSPPADWDMLASSDLVVVGTIRTLSKTHLVLDVKQLVAGRHQGKAVRIKRFMNWMCAQRFAPYAVGQRVAVMANRDPKGGYRIRSAGGEGELPVLGKDVIWRASYSSGVKIGLHKVWGGRTTGARIPLTRFVALVKGLRRCFVFQPPRGKPWRRPLGAKQVCSAAALTRLASSHPAAKALTQQIKAAFRLP